MGLLERTPKPGRSRTSSKRSGRGRREIRSGRRRHQRRFWRARHVFFGRPFGRGPFTEDEFVAGGAVEIVQERRRQRIAGSIVNDLAVAQRDGARTVSVGVVDLVQGGDHGDPVFFIDVSQRLQ